MGAPTLAQLAPCNNEIAVVDEGDCPTVTPPRSTVSRAPTEYLMTLVPPQRPPLPMLVTGIAGVPGYNAFHFFRARYGDQVIGIRQATNWPLRGDGIVPCDVEDERAVAELWDKHQFRTLVNCGGSCRLKSCELDPAMAHRVNVIGLANMITNAVKHDARVVHLSIDLVFSGRHEGGYVETDPTDPVTVYGAKMVEAERIVGNERPDACILRISLPMGISFNGHAGAVDWIASRFKQNKPATLYFDEIRTPTYTDCLNHLLARVASESLAGIYHAGGPRRLSLFEIAQIVNRVGGYDPSLLLGCPRIEAGPMPPRAGNVTLDSSKLAATLGHQPFDPWPIDADFVPSHRDWHYSREDDFAGSSQKIHEMLYQNANIAGAAVPPSRNELWGQRRFH